MAGRLVEEPEPLSRLHADTGRYVDDEDLRSVVMEGSFLTETDGDSLVFSITTGTSIGHNSTADVHTKSSGGEVRTLSSTHSSRIGPRPPGNLSALSERSENTDENDNCMSGQVSGKPQDGSQASSSTAAPPPPHLLTRPSVNWSDEPPPDDSGPGPDTPRSIASPLQVPVSSAAPPSGAPPSAGLAPKAAAASSGSGRGRRPGDLPLPPSLTSLDNDGGEQIPMARSGHHEQQTEEPAGLIGWFLQGCRTNSPRGAGPVTFTFEDQDGFDSNVRGI